MPAIYPYIDYLQRNLRYRVGRGRKVIDIGSGHSPLIRADILCDMFPMETRERAVSAIFMPAGRFVVGDVNDLPFKNKSFDFSYSRAVLEHVVDPVKACNEISRISSAGVLNLPSHLWETMGGSPQHLWLITHKDGSLVFKRKSTQDTLLSELIPRHIAYSREYEKLFLHFYSDFFIDYYWQDTIRVSIDDCPEPRQYTTKDTRQYPEITEKEISSLVARRNSVQRKFRHLLFAFIRALLGGSRVDLLSVIACPACKHELDRSIPQALVCGTCRVKYPFYHGVPILLINSARPI